MAKITSFEKRRGAGRSVFFLLFETFSRERNKEFSVLYEKIQMNKKLGLHLLKKITGLCFQKLGNCDDLEQMGYKSKGFVFIICQGTSVIFFVLDNQVDFVVFCSRSASAIPWLCFLIFQQKTFIFENKRPN